MSVSLALVDFTIFCALFSYRVRFIFFVVKKKVSSDKFQLISSEVSSFFVIFKSTDGNEFKFSLHQNCVCHVSSYPRLSAMSISCIRKKTVP